jgi:hypothetical protein
VFKRTANAHPELVCNPDNKGSGGDCWMNPLPKSAFGPVPWKKFSEYCFRGNSDKMSERAEQILNDDGVFAVHLNNQVTGHLLQKEKYQKGSICDIALQKFCLVCD